MQRSAFLHEAADGFTDNGRDFIVIKLGGGLMKKERTGRIHKQYVLFAELRHSSGQTVPSKHCDVAPNQGQCSAAL